MRRLMEPPECRAGRLISFLLCALLAPLLALAPLLGVAPVSAQGATASQRMAARAASADHVTILILDMSGSMAQNDPNGLRCSAANAYIDLSGPGDYIGVVGLSGNGSGGPNGFGAAQTWATPANMQTIHDQATLKQTIAQRSQQCHPNGATPTYDALSRALGLLKTATAQGGFSGSVILLTDGQPAPQQDAQIAAIQHDLLPQFKQDGFPIDAVALGADQGLHSFLSGLADATGGSYYDDAHGVVPGVSALNIAPFFVDIFAQRNGRIVTHDIPPTALGGATVSRNFSVGDFVSQLAVVAVKDSPSTTVTLTAPNGQTLSSSTAGVLFAGDPHYAIFSIPNPQQGAWQLNVTGSGQFLMDSLKVSTLGLSILAPSGQQVAPLGQPLAIAAQLQSRGVAITGTRYSLTGALTYTGGAGQYTQDFTLDDSASPGVYRAQVAPPAGAPPGAYTITIMAREISDTIASASVSLRIERFPTPALLSPATHQPAPGAVAAQVTQWDPALRLIYGAPVGLLQWLGQWPLQGRPGQPTAVIQGQVYLDGKPYGAATVSGAASHAGARASVPLSVAPGANGAFTASFPATTAGAYTLTLDTQGAFQDSHGDLGVTTRSAQVTVVGATFGQELQAWLITIFYAALIVLAYLIGRYILSPHPFGRLVASDGGGGEEFARSRRGLLWALLSPSVVRSEHMGLGPGLRFLFKGGNRILVKASGAGAGSFRLGGERLTSQAVPATESALTAHDGESSYIISPSGAEEDEDEGLGKRGGLLGRRGRSGDEYDADDDLRPRRGAGLAALGRRRSSAYDDEDDDDRPARRSRSRADDFDDFGDERPSRRARDRSRASDRDDGGRDDGGRASSRARGRRGGRSRYEDDDW